MTPNTSPDGFSYGVNSFGDHYISEVEGDILNEKGAKAEFKRRFGQALFEESTFYVIVGTDSGLLVKYIHEEGIPRDSRYLFVEPQEIIDFLDEQGTLERKEGIVEICSPDEWLGISHTMSITTYGYTSKISFVRACATQLNLYPSYADISLDVGQEVRQLFWVYTSQLDEHVFIKTQLANIAENQIPAILLENKFKGKTAIIMGGGPSLDQLTPWIEAHREEAVLIGVSRISGRFLSSGLVPDIIISIDPQHVSFSVSKEMLKLNTDKTLFVNGSNACPLLVSQWQGRMAFLGPRFPWMDPDFDNIGVIAPTVTNNAILLALKMGCKQIILTGVDLCYSADGYTHASGTKEHDAGPMIGQIDHTVVTNSGAQAETNRGYYAAIDTIVRQASEAAESGCEFINPAPEAAAMEQVRHVPIDELTINSPLEQPAWQTISEVLPEFTSANRRKYYQQTIKALRKKIKEMDTVQTLCQDALDSNEKMATTNNPNVYSTHKNKMDRIEKKLNGRYEPIALTLQRFNAQAFSTILSSETGEEWTHKEVADKIRIYYESFLTAITNLRNIIDGAILRVESRLEEESTHPNFESILNQWRNDVQPYRAHIWKHRHPHDYENLPPETREQFETLLQKFEEFSVSDDNYLSSFIADYATAGHNIEIIIENARSAFEKNDIATLDRLANGLIARKEPVAIEAQKLLMGFIHELNGKDEDAFNAYHDINEEVSWSTKQIALEHTLNMAMMAEKYNVAATILEKLSQHIPSYLPFYAQILEVAGDINKSVNVYTDYLNQNPGNLDVMRQLGETLIRAGAFEAVEAAIDHIKALDPQSHHISTLESLLKQAENAGNEKTSE